MRLRLVVAAVALAVAACQTPSPTKIVEKQTREFEQVMVKSQKPIDVTDNTVILDARSSFDYGLNHVQNSVLFPWEKLSESSPRGEALRDTRSVARQLALVGVRPQTPVVVVGYGPAGRGEEGRLAWELMFFGFEDVQVSSIDAFRKLMTPNESAPVLNEKTWTAEPRAQLQIKRDEFEPLVRDLKRRTEMHLRLIDVRTEKEYLNKSATTVDPEAINIDWKNFYTKDGRPNWAFRARMHDLNIGLRDPIVVVSNHGVRSGAAAYALMAMGYPNVRNFSAGWESKPGAP